MFGNGQKKNQYFRLIAIVLVIIIIILIFFIRFGKINDYPIPTGNVEVFDIDVDIDYADVTKGTIDGATETSNNNRDIGRKIKKYNPDSDRNILGKVFVDDINGNYIYQQNLDIFKNAAFKYTNKIAPGVANTYHFTVHNSSQMNLQYYVEMYEDSQYQVNLRYRLKRNNSYVIGNDDTWVTANELKTAFQYIGESSSDSYSLDWKWFDHDDKADTIAGENMKSLYKLNIRFYFEAVDEL